MSNVIYLSDFRQKHVTADLMTNTINDVLNCFYSLKPGETKVLQLLPIVNGISLGYKIRSLKVDGLHINNTIDSIEIVRQL